MPIIVGGAGKRRIPAIAARFATEYNTPFLSLADFAAQRERVVAACEAIGRDPATITFSAGLVVAVGADEAEYDRRARAIGREPAELRADGVAGTPGEVAATLDSWQQAGAQRLYLQVLDLADLDHLDTIKAAIGR